MITYTEIAVMAPVARVAAVNQILGDLGYGPGNLTRNIGPAAGPTVTFRGGSLVLTVKKDRRVRKALAGIPGLIIRPGKLAAAASANGLVLKR